MKMTTSSSINWKWKTAVAAAIVLSAGAATAAPTASDKCEAAKNKLAGQYYACRQKAEATAINKGISPNYSKCAEKFAEKWAAAETAGDVNCVDDIPLASSIDSHIADQATEIAAVVGGGPPPVEPSCGDNSINQAGEQCDGTAMDGLTCADFGHPYGTLTCTGCQLNLDNCTSCPAPGIEYANSCWFLSPLSASCTTACANQGMVYDEATKLVAGSDGSNANCLALLNLLGTEGDVLNNAGGPCSTFALGCACIQSAGFRGRCGTPATTAGASNNDGTQRVCACK